MLGCIQACIFQSVFYEGLIGQSLQCGSGFGYQNEDGMCYVDRIQNSCCVIRVNVADEFCFHFEAAVFLCPVFQSQIHRTRAKVASADTDLHNGGEFFTCCVGDLTCMYFVRELCDAVLLLYVESTFVYAVCRNGVSELAAGQLMKHETVLSGVDDSTVVKLLKFFRKLCLFCQFYECGKDILIHLFCCVVIRKSFCHRNAVRFYALCSVFAGHHLGKIDTLHFFQLLKRSQFIKIVPGNHC